MRVGRQAPRKVRDKIQDTMADVHDSLIGQHQALPCRSGKGQRLGVTDTGTNESITRMQRVTIVDTYDGPSKTRALILREQMSIVAIDAQIPTDEAQDMYDKINLPKWHTRHPTTMRPKVLAHNLSLDDYSKYLATQHIADHEGCLLHLRIDGVQPFTLPKLNYDGRTGRCDATPSEAIELLPYQTFDIIMPLPSRMLIPYLTQDTKRIRVVGSVRLVNNQGEPPPKLNPETRPTELRTSHGPARRGWTPVANPSPTYPQPHQHYQPSLSYRPAATSQPATTPQSNSPSKRATPSTHPQYTSPSKKIRKLPNGNNNNKMTPLGTRRTGRPNTPMHWPRRSSTYSIQPRQCSRSAVGKKKMTTKKWPSKVIRTSTWSQHTPTLERPSAHNQDQQASLTTPTKERNPKIPTILHRRRTSKLPKTCSETKNKESMSPDAR